MNKTFKIVWNKARRSLMVANEATSSVQAKGTAKVVASAAVIALCGALGSSVIAAPVYSVDGKQLQVDDFTKTIGNNDSIVTIIEDTYSPEGTGQHALLVSAGNKANIIGKNIEIEATGRGVCIYGDEKGDKVGKLTLGNDKTESINIKAKEMGILVLRKNAQGLVKANNINVESSGEFGIHTQSNTQTVTPPGVTPPGDRASLKLVGNNITVTNTYENGGLGLSAFSNSQMDIEGNLTVKASHVIDMRGYATMNINVAKKHDVKLYGDVVFETPGPEKNSGTYIDAYLNLNMTTAKSVWNGGSSKELEGTWTPDEIKKYGQVQGFKLLLSNGATWNNNKESFVNELTLDGGHVNTKDHHIEVTKSLTIAGKTTLSNLDVNKANLDVNKAFTQENNKAKDTISVYGDGVSVEKDAILSLTGSLTGNAEGVLNVAGALDVKGTVEGYLGALYINGGKVALNDTTNFFGGIVNVSDKGVLDVTNLTTTTLAKTTLAKTTIKDSGVFLTTGMKAFGQDANVEINEETSLGNWVYIGVTFETDSLLALNDAEYTLSYAKATAKTTKTKDGYKKVIFKGTLIKPEIPEVGGEKPTVSTDEIGSLDDVILEDVTLNTFASATPTVIVDSTSGVKDVQINAATTKLEVKGDFTLVGSTAGGSLIKGNDDATINVTSGNLNLGTEALNNVKGTIEQALEVASGATLKVNAGSFKAKEVSLSGANADIKAALVVDKLTATGTSKINVGASDKAGSLAADKVALGGGSIYLDPIWQDGGKITDGSKAALQFNNNAVDGQLVVGENSTLTLGSLDSSLAEKAFVASGLTWGDQGILSAVYLNKDQTLDAAGALAGALVVDSAAKNDGQIGDVSHVTPGEVYLGKNGLMIVNKDATLTTTGTVTVTEDAKVYIENATASVDGIVYNLIESTGKVSVTDEKGDLIANHDAMIQFTNTSDENKVQVTAKLEKANEKFAGIEVGDIINKVYEDKKNDVNAKDGAIKFLSRVTNDLYTPSTETARIANQGANIAGFSGIQSVAMSAQGMMTESFAGVKTTDGFTSFAQIQASDEGMDRFDATLGGVVVGGQFAQGNLKAGIAAQYVKGSIDGAKASAGIDTDVKAWSVGAYAATDVEDWTITGDVTYTMGQNDIAWNVLSGNMKADVDTNAMSVGAKAQYNFAVNDSLAVKPYVGVRYTRLTTDGYTSTFDGANAFTVDNATQNVFEMPMGVDLVASAKTASGMSILPMVGFSVVPTFGDKDVETRVHAAGATSVVSSDVLSSNMVNVKFALAAQKDNMKAGFGVGFGVGDEGRSSVNAQANVAWTF